METISAFLTIENEVVYVFPYVDKNSYLYKVFLLKPQIININNSKFVPRKDDIWDRSTKTLISNHKKRKEDILLKNQNDLNNWIYFGYIDKKGKVLLITKWYHDESDRQNYIISVFNNNPIINIKKDDDGFYDDEKIELENNKNIVSTFGV